MTDDVWHKVRSMLLRGMTPARISVRLREEGIAHISHASIYKWMHWNL